MVIKSVNKDTFSSLALLACTPALNVDEARITIAFVLKFAHCCLSGVLEIFVIVLTYISLYKDKFLFAAFQPKLRRKIAHYHEISLSNNGQNDVLLSKAVLLSFHFFASFCSIDTKFCPFPKKLL